MKKQFRDSRLAYTIMVGFYYLGNALFSSMISIYMLDFGYSASQVSLAVGLSQLSLLLVNSQIGAVRERFGGSRVNIVLLCIAICCCFLFISTSHYVLMVLAFTLGSVGIGCTYAMIDRIVLQGPHSYGVIRIWGCLGYAAGLQISGLVYDYIAPQAIFICGALSILLCMVGMMNVIDRQDGQREPTGKVAKGGNYCTLLSNRLFVHYALIVLLVSGPNTVSHTYSAAMLVDEGIGVSLASTVCFCAGLLEVPLVYFSKYYLNRLSNKALLLIMTSIYLIGAFLRGIPVGCGTVVLVTLLTKHLPSMLFIMVNMKVVGAIVDKSNPIMALTTIYSIQCLSNVIFINIAGVILDTFSYRTMFLSCATVHLLALILILRIRVPAGNGKDLFH